MSGNKCSSFFKVMMLVLIPLVLVLVFRECHERGLDKDAPSSSNQDVLLHNGEWEIGQTPSGKSVASATAQLIVPSDISRKNLPDSLLSTTQRQLKIKNSRVMAVLVTSSSTQVDVKSAIATDSQDTADSGGIAAPALLPQMGETPKRISWSDPWISLRGVIEGDTLRAHIESRDTLQVFVHRIPKRFLFFRYGTRKVRVDVVSQNPHTRLSYPKLLVVQKK